MKNERKLVVVSQHYPPDISTTALILSNIAERLATEVPVLVLSGTPGATLNQPAGLSVVEVKNWKSGKVALVKRALAETGLAVRMFIAALKNLQREDVALTVTAPFTLPYAVVAAAKLKRAHAVLLMHDLYPDVLVAAGIIKPNSLLARLIRGANSLMFRGLSKVVIIGRDTQRLLLRYSKLIQDNVVFIPNWATLTPGVRPLMPDNFYRGEVSSRFVVGLSGNLGFTHEPVVVFEAARLLQKETTIHFLLSGWGMGFEELKALQREANLPNVTFIERVPEESLEQLLAAANIWVIPYRKNVAGVSIPSRFYNLLAVGRPVILLSEPEAEAAIIVKENNLGWVIPPGSPGELAEVLRFASSSMDPSLPKRAVDVALGYSLDRAMTSYVEVILELLRNQKLPEQG